MQKFYLLLSFLAGLTLNWWYNFYRKVLDYRNQEKWFNKSLNKTKAVAVYNHETRIRRIVIAKKFSHLLKSKKFDPEFYIEISWPKRVDSFWGKTTYYREFVVRTPKGKFLESYNVLVKN